MVNRRSAIDHNFRNKSALRTVTIGSTDGTSSELQGPVVITQSTENLSEIYLQFANKLDLTSAQTASNYSIPGVPIQSAQVQDNSLSGATVILTVADGAIQYTLEYPLKITGVKGFGGNSEITDFSKMIELKDNRKPYYIEPVVYDKQAKNIIRINFSEQVQGDLAFKITQYNNSAVQYSNTAYVSGNSVTIMLDSTPVNGTYLRLDVLTNSITDISGNPVGNMPTSLYVLASY
jgi:hypothetical protein